MDRLGAIDVDPELQGYLGLATILGSGLAVVVLVVQHTMTAAVGPEDAMYVVTPLIVTAASMTAGIYLWKVRFEGPEMLRISLWVFVGMAVFGLLATWIITHELLRGDDVSFGLFLTVTSVAVGGFIGLIIGWLDASNQVYRRSLEAEQDNLETQLDRLDEFAHMVSHDLRNPLNVASLRLESTRRKNDNADLEPGLETVETSLDRMERIIDDVLTMAREGQGVGDAEEISLAEVARSRWRTVDTRNATLEIASTCRFEADRSGIDHVFENLFRNAIDHGIPQPRAGKGPLRDKCESAEQMQAAPANEGRNLAIRVGTLDDGFFIEDDGVGIDDSVVDSLFESGVTTSPSGTGFGLRIVDNIVDAHGWRIAVTESVDGGARFEIRNVDLLD